MSPDNTNKTEIDGIKFQSCEQLQSVSYLDGENAIFPCHGHIVDAYPNQTDQLGFNEVVHTHKNVLFGESARGLNVEVTLYSPR